MMWRMGDSSPFHINWGDSRIPCIVAPLGGSSIDRSRNEIENSGPEGGDEIEDLLLLPTFDPPFRAGSNFALFCHRIDQLKGGKFRSVCGARLRVSELCSGPAVRDQTGRLRSLELQICGIEFQPRESLSRHQRVSAFLL